MNETVAIVGSHPATREDFDFDRTDADIWGFNEALNTDWFKHADGIFQIHKPIIWRSSTNRNDPNHYPWLKSGETPVIFMQDKFDDVPKSERYPFEAIKDAFPTMKEYFTSSVAYAIALAIYKGYKRIEVYGVEMETNTEYGHQRGGIYYWCGFANGKGIEVDFHSPTLFTAPLYGYDGDVRVPIDFYQEQMAEAEKHRQGATEKFEEVRKLIDGMLAEFVKTYKADLSMLDSYILALRDNAQMIGLFEGMARTCESYIEKCELMQEESGSYLIVRQEFEGQGVGATKALADADGKMRKLADRLHKHRDDLNTYKNREVRIKLVESFIEHLMKFIESVSILGRLKGVIQMNQRIISRYDELLIASGIEPEDENIPIEVKEVASA